MPLRHGSSPVPRDPLSTLGNSAITASRIPRLAFHLRATHSGRHCEPCAVDDRTRYHRHRRTVRIIPLPAKALADCPRPGTIGDTSESSRARLLGRAGLARVRGPKFEVFGTLHPELRTSNRAIMSGKVRRRQGVQTAVGQNRRAPVQDRRPKKL